MEGRGRKERRGGAEREGTRTGGEWEQAEGVGGPGEEWRLFCSARIPSAGSSSIVLSMLFLLVAT